jgi:hypothetical protein
MLVSLLMATSCRQPWQSITSGLTPKAAVNCDTCLRQVLTLCMDRLRTLALPKEVEHWSLTTLRAKKW